jgi:PAS domain S-box-containing protein
MTDPGQQPTTDDLRDFPRKLRETARREESRAQNEELGANRQEVDRERRQYRELFDFAPDAYLVTDVYGTIRDANIASGRLLGVEARFLTGKQLPSFFDENGRREYRHQLDHLCDFDRLDDWQIVLRPRHRERVVVSVSITRGSQNETEAGAYRWMLRDITQRVRTEETLRNLNHELELQLSARTAQLAAANRTRDDLLLSERRARQEAEIANRVKADFLALLSHEFRTPLQAIFGYTELLERQIHGPLNEAQLRDLRRIQQSQQHLLGLINSILEFARLDSGSDIDVHFCPTVVNEILCEMEGFIGSQLEKRQLQYEYNCSDPTVVARTDPTKVQQIVLNLLANAMKFTPAGGHICLDCQRERETVAIRVVDSGIGIPRDKLDAVFQPFVQLGSPLSSGEGTGLGLPISRRLAAAMGGTLTASSDTGTGSTFTLRLPLANA